MSTQELTASDPATVGPYRLLQRLGSGGMGVVYLATSGADPGAEPVALKCLPPGVGGEVRGRLRREASYLSAVRHPRVAAFVAADTTADRPWIAMDYIAGPSLAQASVPLGPAQLRHLCEGLADALAALHRQGLTHRDVKPGNIILTHDGPVLVDLGIAAGGELTALTAVGMVVGTPEWMAPEQLLGQTGGHATDLWGWAAVATYAATGRTPFGSGAIEALAHRIRYEQPDLRAVPDWLRGAVTACFAKDPAGRPGASQLAAVDGIRTVGRSASGAAAGRTPAPVPVPQRSATPVPRWAPPVLSSVPSSRPAPPQPMPPVAPARPSPRSTRREQARARDAARSAARNAAKAESTARAVSRRKARRRPRPTVVEPVPAARPAPAPRRRSWLRRLVRRVVLTVLVLAALVALGLLAYTWAASAVQHSSWWSTVRDVRTSVANFFGGR